MIRLFLAVLAVLALLSGHTFFASILVVMVLVGSLVAYLVENDLIEIDTEVK